MPRSVRPPQVLGVPGVIGYSEPHFWENSSDKYVGTLRVQVRDCAADTPQLNLMNGSYSSGLSLARWWAQVTHDADEQRVRLFTASIFKKIGVNNFVVQVEKTG